MTDKENKIVVLREFNNIYDANIALGVLRANGINCELENQLVGGVSSIVGALSDSIRLIVFETDLERARQLLNQ
jgi:hypothetical protein